MTIITMTTDFGEADWFAGTMRGVILGIAPYATVLDITHGIPAGDIRAGAFALAASFRFFPRHTIHLAVVDPGVGSRRRAIAVQTEDYVFIAPDNGLLAWSLRHEQVKAVHSLANERYFLRPVSRTFHGRDIFAPSAAHLARGVPLSDFGPRVSRMVPLPWPEPVRTGDIVRGEVLYIDRFGNAVTNIEVAQLASLKPTPLQVCWRPGHCCPMAECYSAVARGRPLALGGSSGMVEIAINGGNAAEGLELCVGSRITLRPA